ncbi:MAG: 2-amino-4-hydroxy-6-hydroxymethyldihydropteridine pyrophosphokinase [Gammaproteobacteria bacterium]|nr:2-amino-4-hydroxy-6-hydroxymethyldihydropteridine pyrophosphokinase [Gammaproteobacteria bacterium]
MGIVSQPSFINAAVQIETRLQPPKLLAELQKIERRFGRIRALRWGPRTLDLDILVYADIILDRPGLLIPHPRIPCRPFVLYPLLELTSNLYIPGMGTPSSLIRCCRGPVPLLFRESADRLRSVRPARRMGVRIKDQ